MITRKEMVATAKTRRTSIIRMRKSGLTFQQIADRLSVSRQRAHKIWKTAVERKEV